MAFRDSFDKCPRCGVTLEDAQDARGCRSCGGAFIGQPVLAEMILQMLPPPPRVWGALSLSDVKRGEELACPQCGDAMKPTVIHEVELDHCSKHGVWFDVDELRITLYRVADPKNPPPFEEWEPAPLLPTATPSPLPIPRTSPRGGPPAQKRDLEAPELVFSVRQPDALPREVVVQAGVIKVGKMEKAHLRIDDSRVSRMHAVIEATPKGIVVIDLGSSSGTYVNGEKTNKATIVVGDTLRFGDAEVQLVRVG